MMPPCVIVMDPKPSSAQTYVIKSSSGSENQLKHYACKNDACRYAIVTQSEFVYLVISFENASCTTNKDRNAKEWFSNQYRGAVSIEWMQPLTRFLQSLLRLEQTPGADAVDPAILPAIQQMTSLPMLEDCRHWHWSTETKGLEEPRKVRVSTVWQETGDDFRYRLPKGPCANGALKVIDEAKGIFEHKGPYT